MLRKIFFYLILFFSIGCSEDSDIDIANEFTLKIQGTYNVTSLRRTTYDTLGNISSDTIFLNPGTFRFVHNDISTLCYLSFSESFGGKSAMLDHLINNGCTERYAGYFTIDWDGDAMGHRIFLSGINAQALRYHRTANIDDPENFKRMTYINPRNITSPYVVSYDLVEIFELMKQ